MRASTLLAVKSGTIGFIKNVTRIYNQLVNRLLQHKLKLDHLHLLFKRERDTMMTTCVDRIKNKKYKKMLSKLQMIDPDQQVMVLQEYFNMCKNVFRIRSTIAYTLQGGKESFDEAQTRIH